MGVPLLFKNWSEGIQVSFQWLFYYKCNTVFYLDYGQQSLTLNFPIWDDKWFKKWDTEKPQYYFYTYFSLIIVSN